MSERQTTPDFEDEVRLAMRSYAEEGARAFDPGRISAQARSGGAGALRLWPGRTSPLVELTGLRFALLLVLLGAALAALAVVGSRLVTPPAPVPGLLAMAVMDQIIVVDPRTGTSVAITAPNAARWLSGLVTGRDAISSSRSTTAGAGCSSWTPTVPTATRSSAT